MPLGSRSTSATTFLATSRPRLHRRCHKSPIDAAHDQWTPTSRRHRPPRNSTRRHATQRSRAVEIPHAVPPAPAARGTVLTRSPRRSSADPHLPTIPVHYPARRSTSAPPHSPTRRAAPPAYPEHAATVVHRRRRPLRLPASPCTAAPRSTPRCRPLQRDAQHHSQRQRTPPSFAIAATAFVAATRTITIPCGIPAALQDTRARAASTASPAPAASCTPPSSPPRPPRPSPAPRNPPLDT
ncbi:hypothetical protein DFH09DRAFT_79737 [Mycena vulgaris]|nr:hypothetical protein DFH09DRAFT_79737 [Mycena vulgaris]